MATSLPPPYNDCTERDQDHGRRADHRASIAAAPYFEDPPPPYDSLEGISKEPRISAESRRHLEFPTRAPFQVSQNRRPYPTLSILEDKWTFNMVLTTKSRFLERTQELYEITVPGQNATQPWACIMVSNSKAGKTKVRFENRESGTNVFMCSSLSNEEHRRVTVTLPLDVELGTTERRRASSGDKITDLVSSTKFAVNKIRLPSQSSYLVIKDAISEEEFARFEKRREKGWNMNRRTLNVTNSKTTPAQKALFLGYTFLLVKRFQEGATAAYT